MLLQTYISQLKLDGFALMSDMVYISQVSSLYSGFMYIMSLLSIFKNFSAVFIVTF